MYSYIYSNSSDSLLCDATAEMPWMSEAERSNYAHLLASMHLSVKKELSAGASTLALEAVAGSSRESPAVDDDDSAVLFSAERVRPRRPARAGCASHPSRRWRARCALRWVRRRRPTRLTPTARQVRPAFPVLQQTLPPATSKVNCNHSVFKWSSNYAMLVWELKIRILPRGEFTFNVLCI